MERPSPCIDPQWLSRPSPEVAPDLIGCVLVRQLADGTIVRGLIVEIEAYAPDDPACHAYRRRTPRNSVMFGPAGVSYVYLIYGIHHCLNVVTDLDGLPSAVLIRALQLEGIPPWITCQETVNLHRLAAGPGKLCQTLKIDRSLNGILLQPDSPLWLEHRSDQVQQQLEVGQFTLTQTTRIGLTEGVELPWRWYLTNCLAVSKKG
jgi:DNA-3-methyladenine glycosylase